MVPEVVARVAQQLDEGHHGAPRVWAVHDEALQERSGHDLAEPLVVDFCEQEKQQRAEPVRVRIGVAQVHDGGTENMVLTYTNDEFP